MALDPTQIATIVERHFQPLVAPLDCAAPGKAPGILVGLTQGTQVQYFQFGEVMLAEPTGAKPAPEEIVVWIGSNTKVVTATLLALTHSAESPAVIPVGLYTPAAQLLPKGIGIGSYQDQPILLRHLASHSAGFPDGPCGEQKFGDYTFEMTTKFLRTFAPPYPPGQLYHYSDQGFALLGALLSHAYRADGDILAGADWDVSYQAWPQIARQYITAPLGMNCTQVDYMPVIDRVAQGFGNGVAGQAYPKVASPVLVLDSAALGAGALSSTLADMVRFLQAQIAPPAGPLGEAIALTHQLQGEQLATGLGWQLGNGYFYKDGLVPGHASFMAFDPVDAIGLFAYANSWGGDHGASLGVATREVLGELRGPPAWPGKPMQPVWAPQCPV
ncbi:serine hydrolase domain-containing protein [Pseudomonas sp. CGJS7]|uniref:serine hydrolase domain-containing protein n=1 Tax=Pseudomonas sp. CGJS7 TaxID=3109348 RepID=UPI00300B6BA8